jgi:hypothetical protein
LFGIAVGPPVATDDAALVTNSGLTGGSAFILGGDPAVHDIDVTVVHPIQTFSVCDKIAAVIGGVGKGAGL